MAHLSLVRSLAYRAKQLKRKHFRKSHLAKAVQQPKLM